MLMKFVPFYVTPGERRPHPQPGWTFVAGGGDRRGGPFVFLTLEDPDGHRWVEWFCKYFGVRVAIPEGMTVTFKR